LSQHTSELPAVPAPPGTVGPLRTAAPDDAVLNAMTVDVEEHFQVSAFAETIDRSAWEHLPSRVEANTDRLLELFGEHRVHATFFVLGWVAERHPRLVSRIAAAGHEIACHGWGHGLVYRQRPEQFREEVVRAKHALEDGGGAPVLGYRAASFSVTRDSLWALDVLAACGFTYDSSLFPVFHDRYGIPGAPRHVYRARTPAGGTLLEVPPSTVRVGPFVLPVAGGGYLRHYPWPVTRWAVRRLNLKERVPAVVYVHPWELDPGQPRIAVPWVRRLRHYGGIAGTVVKLRSLLRDFAFGPVRDMLERTGPVPECKLP
jgi:polysaccharide deacetylase family protein (PEP-CTERM system associated)